MKIARTTSLVLAANLVLGVAVMATAADTTMSTLEKKSDKVVATPDAQNVLADLHQANLSEIAMGKMAKEKGQSDEVKSFGDKLVQDHSNADAQVKRVAKSAGIDLTPTADKAQEAKADQDKDNEIMQRLHSLSGAEFDKAFTAVMVKDHQKDIAKLKDAQSRLPASPVKNLVAKVLPKLQDHLDIAEKIQKNI